jgi:hypothetical protein
MKKKKTAKKYSHKVKQKAAEYLLKMPLFTYAQALEQQKRNNPDAFPKPN